MASTFSMSYYFSIDFSAAYTSWLYVNIAYISIAFLFLIIGLINMTRVCPKRKGCRFMCQPSNDSRRTIFGGTLVVSLAIGAIGGVLWFKVHGSIDA